MALTINEIAERGLAIDEFGRVIDTAGNEYRDENGEAHRLRPAYQDLLEAEYVAIYMQRDDADWDLLLVCSQTFLSFDPNFLIGFYEDEENYLCVASDTNDVPDVWSEEV